MKRSSYELTVRGYELDSFGHVNNAVYLQYSETALWNFLKVHGLLDLIIDAGLFPVIMESTQRYIHELKMLDEVRIDTEISCSCGIISYRHKIVNKNTGHVSCRVKGKLAFVNKERMICNIPDTVRAYLEGEENDDQ
jgi:acyl-CoA thioester hydrolase